MPRHSDVTIQKLSEARLQREEQLMQLSDNRQPNLGREKPIGMRLRTLRRLDPAIMALTEEASRKAGGR